MPKILYLKSKSRRPVSLRPRLPFQDTQAVLPQGWCSRCGSEVFQPEQTLCIHCRGVKGAY